MIEDNESDFTELVPQPEPELPADQPETPLIVEPQDITNLKLVSDWVGRTASLDDEKRNVIKSVLENPKEELNTVMVAVSRRAARRVVALMDYIDAVEDEIASPVRLARADSRTLDNVHKALQTQLKLYLDQISKIVEGPALKISLQNGTTSEETFTFDLPSLNKKESREKVRTAFGLLMKMADKLDLEAEDQPIDGKQDTTVTGE